MDINLLLLIAVCTAPEGGFVDHTDAIGLGPDIVPETVSRLCFADLDGDDYPDAVIDRHRVFLNRPDGDSPIGRSFLEIPPDQSGLRIPVTGTVTVFADLDNDGHVDAIVAEYINRFDDKWEDHGRRTCWQKGRGDGTFGTPQPIKGAQEATACAIAVGDVNRDGRLDLWLGNWYARYGASYAGFQNDLLLQQPRPPEVGEAAELRWSPTLLPVGVEPIVEAPEEEDPFDEENDADGRPTYGAMIADLDNDGTAELLELNYGRRWSRCFHRPNTSSNDWLDIAPKIGFDGDDIRHGRYPDWLKERAKEDPRFDREDEEPFRANGNTFDCSIGDIDNDGDFDIFLAEITHGWAGESSDRSRVLLNQTAESGQFKLFVDTKKNIDRVPADKNSWNQGDLFCELADLDHDGRLDLILCSGDYPDNQRLRIFLQQPDGSVRDATEYLGIDHDGSHQVSLADVDCDGDLDMLVGQTFFRFTKEMKEGRSPRIRLFINEATEGRKSITLRLRGDGAAVNRDALGAAVRIKLSDGTIISRLLTGIGGHAGMQRDFIVHFGLGPNDIVEELNVTWPDQARTTQRFEDVAAGRYTLHFGGTLEEVKRD